MSEDQEIQPDPVVETALRLLPVPDHGEAFWDRFAQALAAEPAHGEPDEEDEHRRNDASTRRRVEDARAPDTAGVPVLELVSTDHLHLVPSAVRRRSNAVLSAVAVAAAVVVVVAATSLVRSRGGDTADVADDQQATEQTEQTDPTETTLATLTAPDDDSPHTAVVFSWINALAEGDMDAAWEVLSPAAQAGWGDKAAFEAERTAFAEGYAAWAHTKPQQVLVTPVVSAANEDISIVTLVGMVEQEGVKNMRADAFPVRITGDKAELHLSPVSAGIEFVSPDTLSNGAYPKVTDDSLVVVVPAEASAPILRLDEGDLLFCGDSPDTELTELSDGYGQRCELQPKDGLPDGVHVLTAAYMSDDGSGVTAQSVVFEAA